MRAFLLVCGYRSCTLPTRLPPGVLLIKAHGVENFKDKAYGDFFISHGLVRITSFLSRAYSKSRAEHSTRAVKLGEFSAILAIWFRYAKARSHGVPTDGKEDCVNRPRISHFFGFPLHGRPETIGDRGGKVNLR
jgi:hypothetical protein